MVQLYAYFPIGKSTRLYRSQFCCLHYGMKVDELIIDGFKSYQTRTVISGWDSQFNAITGLNGSGKSNILDAICFVLGIAAMSTVRAANLQDLIYKRGQAGVTKASVTIVFNNHEKSKSPIGFDNCSTISITRQIILGGSSKYLINGHKAQQQTVLNLFQSVQLNINNPNFLIMQGKITKVLNMKPLEILSLIEEAAGTRTFEERKDKAQKTMEKKESKLIEIKNLLNEEIEPKLEKLRNDKRNFLTYQQTQIDLEKLARIIAAHSYKKLSNLFTNHNNLLSENESKMSILNKDIEKFGLEIISLNDDLNQVKRQRESELDKDGKIKELELLENQLSNDSTRIHTSSELTLENYNEELKKLSTLEENLKTLQSNLTDNISLYGKFESNYNKAQDHLQELKSDYNKKEELVSTLSTGVSATGNLTSGYSQQLKETKDKLNLAQNYIRTSKLKINHLQDQIKSDKDKLLKAQQENLHMVQNIKVHKSEIDQLQSELNNKLGFDPNLINDLRNQEASLKKESSRLENELNYIKRDIGNFDFNYTRPSPNFDDRLVRGTVGQLFNLPESSNDLAEALQTCAGGRLYNVVVDTSDVASQILERGQLKRRVTLIPLDKIKVYSIPPRTTEYAKQIAPGKVELAINLIEYEPEVAKAMEYIFSSTFICNDPLTAKNITFDPKIRSRSITLDGDVYDPEGNLSGGSKRGNSAVLIKLQQYNRCAQKLNSVQDELSKVQKELHHMESLFTSTKELQNNINLKTHQLSLFEKKLDNNPSSKILKQNEISETEIKQLTKGIETEDENIKRYKTEINQIEEDISEFSTDKGSKLKQLQSELEKAKKHIKVKELEMEKIADKFQSMQIENDQKKSEVLNLEESITQCKASSEELIQKSKQLKIDESDINDRLKLVKVELEEERSKILGLDDEINELNRIIKLKQEIVSKNKLEIQKLTHELEKSNNITKNLKSNLDNLIQENDWVTDANIVNNIIEQYANINLEECHDQLSVLKDKIQTLKRKVNVNIMNMIENVEKKEASLKQMVKTIEKDKSKILATINKLNGYKRDTLNTTYQKVSIDFGDIFADLLPGSFAKLVPVNMMDVTKGLEVKVKLGQIWKASLVELSGGQRSLVALSLIMALLQFKPAPMYILDEVDSALDLSHTQNIGHLIKTRFKGSQFIVVSLKEGMFTNANRVFRTRFQDGTSVVSIM